MTTRKKIRAIGLFFVIAVFAACSGKKEAEQPLHDEAMSEDVDVWPEMDEFHQVMADCFHPFKDSANLEPAKTYADAMARSAEKWMNSTVPPSVDNDEVKGRLKELKRQADEFAVIVHDNDEVAIGEQLSSVHDIFHELQEAWYSSKSDDHSAH